MKRQAPALPPRRRPIKPTVRLATAPSGDGASLKEYLLELLTGPSDKPMGGGR